MNIRGQLYTAKALERRKRKLLADGYPISKWIEFCEAMHAVGLNTLVYEAKSTLSKYVYVERDGKAFKVRFSNHAPRLDREVGGECDFFVGKTNLGVSTTRHAIEAAKAHFGIDDRRTCKVCLEKVDDHSMQPSGICVFCPTEKALRFDYGSGPHRLDNGLKLGEPIFDELSTVDFQTLERKMLAHMQECAKQDCQFCKLGKVRK